MTKKAETIKNTSNFVKCVNDFKRKNESAGNNAELLFREQGADKPLLPKIARLNLRITTDSIAKTEKLILKEFKRGILPLSEFRPDNNWDLLALAQHHGLPTRLFQRTLQAFVMN